MDESLLAQIDADPDVHARGRSAIMRDALQAWLRRRERERVDDAYRRGYGQTPQTPEELDLIPHQAWNATDDTW